VARGILVIYLAGDAVCDTVLNIAMSCMPLPAPSLDRVSGRGQNDMVRILFQAPTTDTADHDSRRV
jgi:hypothetical protein